MLWGVPPEVNRFFAPIVRNSSKPIQKALAAMVLAFLLAPHYRRLKTVAGMVLGHRVHVATISRRLHNPAWTTLDWYVSCTGQVLSEASRFEWSFGGDKRRKRRYMVIIDTTYHSSVGEKMENLLVMSKRKDPRRRNTRQHVFVMGLLITESGVRIPLPRLSYYTKEYCAAKNKKYQTQNQLARLMINTAPVPADADVTVVFDSAFDADLIHRACRKRGFREVFPIDPNRNLATTNAPHARAQAGAPVVASTLEWKDQEFETLELECDNEDFALFRRRHVDNFRAKKTHRKYVYAARHLSVSKLGDCLIVASYKENPNIKLLPGQSNHWKDYRQALATRRKKDRKQPSRWSAKVLACTDPNVTAREVIQWYEIRWHIETFFRELKSRMQLGCYVLMKFEAVERYIDLLLMGFLVLEMQRLRDLRNKNAWPKPRDPHSLWRVTDRLRDMERMIQRFNFEYVRARIRTKRGQAELLARLAEEPCQVA
jgi:hypothetical protein